MKIGGYLFDFQNISLICNIKEINLTVGIEPTLITRVRTSHKNVINF